MMTNTILKTLLDVHEDLLSKFNNLIDQYDKRPEEGQMTAFTNLSGEFNNIIGLEWNVVFPLLSGSPKIADLKNEAIEKRNALAETYERLTMIHVDEPDHLFYEGLVEVRDLFQAYHSIFKAMLLSPLLALDENQLLAIETEYRKIFYGTAINTP